MQWHSVVAILVFMAFVLLPATLVWDLSVGALYEEMERRRQVKTGRSGAVKATSRGLAVSHKLALVGLSVMASFVVYGLGLWAGWGGRLSLAVALATPAALAPLALFLRAQIRHMLVLRRSGYLRLAILAAPALIPPALIWLLIGGVDWRMALALTLAAPVILVAGAFVWHLIVSGLYNVVHAHRAGPLPRLRDAHLRRRGALCPGNPRPEVRPGRR